MEAQARIRENWMTLGDETAISQSSLTRDLSLQASSLEAGLLLCVLRQNPMFFCCSIQQELWVRPNFYSSWLKSSI